MSALRMAAGSVEPLALCVSRHARAAVSGVRGGMEYVRDTRMLSWLLAPVALDVMSSVRDGIPS